MVRLGVVGVAARHRLPHLTTYGWSVLWMHRPWQLLLHMKSVPYPYPTLPYCTLSLPYSTLSFSLTLHHNHFTIFPPLSHSRSFPLLPVSDRNRRVLIRGVVLDNRGLPYAFPVAANKIVACCLLAGTSAVHRDGQLIPTTPLTPDTSSGGGSGGGPEGTTVYTRRRNMMAMMGGSGGGGGLSNASSSSNAPGVSGNAYNSNHNSSGVASSSYQHRDATSTSSTGGGYNNYGGNQGGGVSMSSNSSTPGRLSSSGLLSNLTSGGSHSQYNNNNNNHNNNNNTGRKDVTWDSDMTDVSVPTEIEVPATFQMDHLQDWSICKPGHRQGKLTELGENKFAVEVMGEPVTWIFSRSPSVAGTVTRSPSAPTSSSTTSASLQDMFQDPDQAPPHPPTSGYNTNGHTSNKPPPPPPASGLGLGGYLAGGLLIQSGHKRTHSSPQELHHTQSNNNNNNSTTHASTTTTTISPPLYMGNNSNIWHTTGTTGGGSLGGGSLGASMRSDTSRLGLGTSFVYLIEVRFHLSLQTGQSLYAAIPRHPFGELAKNRTGIKALERKKVVPDLLAVAKNDASPHDDRRGALWGLGHVACSEEGLGIILQWDAGFVEWCVQGALTAPNYSLRATLFYTLGLIGRSPKGARQLARLHWDIAPIGQLRTLHPPQPLLYSRSIPTLTPLSSHLTSSSPLPLSITSSIILSYYQGVTLLWPFLEIQLPSSLPLLLMLLRQYPTL